MDEEKKGDDSREKKMLRIDFLVSRKNFIEKFLLKCDEEENNNSECLTRKQIMEAFELKITEEFEKLMNEHDDLWSSICQGDTFSEHQTYALMTKNKREQLLREINRELKVLFDTAGKNDANNISVTSTNNSEIHLLADDLKMIHPVQDFFEDKAWTTAILPYTEKIEKGENFFVEETKNGKFLINSNRDKPMLLNKSVMKKGIGSNIYLKVFPEFVEPRWDRKSIISFLNGNNPHFTLAEIFKEVRDHIKYYVELEDEKQYDVVASWIIATYFFEMFDSFGYLYLTGTKRVGKTKLLKIIASLAFNGKLNIGIKTASLFRSIHNSKLTLCLDEIDANTLKNDTDLNEVLRGGYIKGHSVPRTERNENTGSFEVRQHEFYSPKALCNITGIDDVIEDRAITIVMVRSSNPLLNMRDVNMNDQKWNITRNKLYINMMENFCEILKHKTDVEQMKINDINSMVSVVSADSVDVVSDVDVCISKHGHIFENVSEDNNSEKISYPQKDYTNYTNNTTYIHTYNDNKTEKEGGLEGFFLKPEKKENIVDSRNYTSTPKGVGVDSVVSADSVDEIMTLKNISQRNYQISVAVLAVAHAVSQDIYNNVVSCLASTFERKRMDESSESSDVTLIEILVAMVESKRWWKTSSIADSMKVTTEEQWANPKWVGRALKRIFPTIEKRRMSQGIEVLLSPEMVRGRAEKIGLDVEQILLNTKYNPMESMNDMEKIKYKLKTDMEMYDYKIVEWAVEQGVKEEKAEQIIQKLKNEGYIMEIRAGILRWAVK
jgi:hypothetical protein